MIHAVHNIDDPELRMRVGIGPIVGGVQTEVYLTIWTQYPPCNSPDDAKPTTHVKISNPL